MNIKEIQHNTEQKQSVGERDTQTSSQRYVVNPTRKIKRSGGKPIVNGIGKTAAEMNNESNDSFMDI